MSRWVWLPQVPVIFMSGYVALDLVKSEGVGACFGTGLPGLPSEGRYGTAIAMTLESGDHVAATSPFSEHAAPTAMTRGSSSLMRVLGIVYHLNIYI